MWELRYDQKATVERDEKNELAPCQVRCPIHEDIQRTNILISLLSHDRKEAQAGAVQIGDYLHQRNPLFTVCGYVCGLCERECNYKDKTGAVRRRMLKRFLSDMYTPYLGKKPAMTVKKNAKKVAVVGGGPGGLFCAWELAKLGYQVTIFDNNPKLGGAVRFIPKYRLPEKVLDAAVDNLVRVGNIKTVMNKTFKGDAVKELTEQGFDAVFMATGTPYPRPLTFSGAKVAGQDFAGVEYGLTMLGEANAGRVKGDRYKGKKVIVIGGGNVAFDVARTAVRLGGKVTVVCLENQDKKTKDGIPADLEEIEGAEQEGIHIMYSRGVDKIVGSEGRVTGITSPKCVAVFDEKGFNPRFQCEDTMELQGDSILVTIGQGWDRQLLIDSGLFDENGKLAVNPWNLQSQKRPNVFVGGDVRKVGYAVDAMAEGIRAARSIDLFLNGKNLDTGITQLGNSKTPLRRIYKKEPKIEWVAPDKRMNFDMVEVGLTLEEAIAEGKRCLTCGPCVTCKACVGSSVQSELPYIELDEENCCGCAMCVSACNYEAIKIVEKDGRRVSEINPTRCKACGMCVVACPSEARVLINGDAEVIKFKQPASAPQITCVSCKFGWAFSKQPKNLPAARWVRVPCVARFGAPEIIHELRTGSDGVLLLGCSEGDCHFMDGEDETVKKLRMLRRVIKTFGIDPNRVEARFGIDPDGSTMSKHIADFAKKVKKMETPLGKKVR